MDQGAKLTNNIVKLVTDNPPLKQNGAVDIDAVMYAVGWAYLGFARSFYPKEAARELLVFLLEELDKQDSNQTANENFPKK